MSEPWIEAAARRIGDLDLSVCGEDFIQGAKRIIEAEYNLCDGQIRTSAWRPSGVVNGANGSVLAVPDSVPFVICDAQQEQG